MDNNPYQTPKSDVVIDSNFKRSLWWKAYFFFLNILCTFAMISLLADPMAGFAEYINLILWLTSTVGLFGFVFLKPIYKPKFWLQILIAYVVFNVLYDFITDVDIHAGMSGTGVYISAAIGWLLSFPAFYGLYAYSKSTDPAWKHV